MESAKELECPDFAVGQARAKRRKEPGHWFILRRADRRIPPQFWRDAVEASLRVILNGCRDRRYASLVTTPLRRPVQRTAVTGIPPIS